MVSHEHMKAMRHRHHADKRAMHTRHEKEMRDMSARHHAEMGGGEMGAAEPADSDEGAEPTGGV